MRSSIILSLSLMSGLMVTTALRADTVAFDKQMQVVLGDYLKVQGALASDSIEGVSRAAKQIHRSAARLKPGSVTGAHRDHYKSIPSNLQAAAAELAEAKDVKAARAAFQELSKPMAMWASMSKPGGIDVVFCSMAKGSWLQKAGEIRNPYYGAKMLNCGEVVSSGA